MDTAGKRVQYETTRSAKGPGFVSFATQDPKTGAWIDSIDFESNGSVDYRTTESADGTSKRELSVDQRWLEVVKRDGRDGVVLDGEFMTAAAAREKLSARQTSQPSR